MPTEETTKAKTPNDLDLAIAEMVHNRQPYQLIAKKLKVSPKTISKVTKMMTEGDIKIGADGKAEVHKNAQLTGIGPLPTQLQMEILGAAHLEGKSPQDLIAGLIRLDRKMRLKELNLDQLELVQGFLEKAYSRDWTSDLLIDILTRLQNSGFSKLDQQLLNSLREFLESAKSRNLKPEQIIQTTQKTESEWKKHIQEAYGIGLQDGKIEYESYFLKLANQSITNLDLLRSIANLAELAELGTTRRIKP